MIVLKWTEIHTVSSKDVAHGLWFLAILVLCRYSLGFAGEVVSNASAVVENAIAISSVWRSPLALLIEMYTVSHGFPAF